MDQKKPRRSGGVAYYRCGCLFRLFEAHAVDHEVGFADVLGNVSGIRAHGSHLATLPFARLHPPIRVGALKRTSF